MTDKHPTDALREALSLLDEIVLAGMSGTGMESQEAMDAFHARQAWRFISIAAKAKEKLKALAASKPEPQETEAESRHSWEAVLGGPEPQAQAGEPLTELAEQLCVFYGVTTYSDLVAAQARHIEKLQAKLGSPRDEQPGKVRFA